MKTPRTIVGIDFSGAKLAGANIWLAEAIPSDVGARLRLKSLNSLAALCGTSDREPSLAWLVDHIASASGSLIAADFPFGLPIEVVPGHADWASQLNEVSRWTGTASELGLEFVRRARLLGEKMHIRRTTDSESRTPFDCYHYRIIYQTFHGMRDLLRPLATSPRVAILPFQYARVKTADTVVLEACPSSTLKRLTLPHQNYKQPAGGPLLAKRRRTRQAILAGLRPLIELTDRHVRTIMRNPGGDALDAVIAAVGGWYAWHHVDHRAIASHDRYPQEGYVYY